MTARRFESFLQRFLHVICPSELIRPGRCCNTECQGVPTNWGVDMTQRKRACLFCESSAPLTKEHLLPRWVERQWQLFPATPDKRRWRETLQRGGSRPGALGPPQTVVHENQLDVPLPRKTVRVVCEACNSGWMSHLERRFIPLATSLSSHNDMRFLASHEIALLRQWALKTAVVYEHSQPEITPIITRDQAARIAVGDLPDDILVLLARLDRTAHGGVKMERSETVFRDPEDPPIEPGVRPPSDVQFTTLLMGHTVMQIRASRANPSPINLRAVGGPGIIFANDVDIAMWPPNPELSEIGFRNFARWLFNRGPEHPRSS
ncbi:hypothetical protein PBI_BLUEBERRY_34 [Gordonia phage Blueberry]|uniref:HNH endonuclease n=1 Tax=Gordonia phage Azula TaxID=2762397 RepID=A0A7G8LKS3_9CAUD|nr:hypothetical protein BH771_gp34 [Gordonia phage Blueberry]YP_010109960.1 hypothetical protein KNV23_gp34 [Gordonia phage Azula]ANA85496.1 hypothetical protein PBI_BLUEBERRY_34 [Gordonia phage Blueberry]QNJ57845.1 hypothetical protein SEA_AZULA_34 [Gordonia phage Azula]QZD97466.1 hypothetical protein SEA_MISSRONA_34 [Gordonia phage MissRona]